MDEDYNLSPGEVVIMQSEAVVLHSGKDRDVLNEIVLTNQNLILVNVISTGFFTTQRLLKRCPLDSIACPEGVPQAFLGKKKDEHVLQVVFEQEAITLSFPDNPKREAKRWADAIKCAVVGEMEGIDTDESPLPSDMTDLIDGFKSLTSAFVGEAASFTSTVPKASKPVKKAVKTKATVRCMGCRAPLSGNKGAILTCDYCGTKQTL